MEPSPEEPTSCTSQPSRAPRQSSESAAPKSQEGDRGGTKTEKGVEEKTSAFAAELEEIRRISAARYRASKEALSRPSPAATTALASHAQPFRCSDSRGGTASFSGNEQTKREQGGDSSGEGGRDSEADQGGASSPAQCNMSSQRIPSEASYGRTVPPHATPTAGSTGGEVEVIDTDGEDSDVVSVSAPKGDVEKSKMNRKRALSPECTLPIWEDQLDLLTWNVDGLDGQALRPRTTAVLDLIVALRPAVVFLQEVVAPSLAMLREKLKNSYYIFTPSRTSWATNARISSGQTSGFGTDGRRTHVASGALHCTEPQDDVSFPYFVVLLLCREQMVPLTPEGLCEWFSGSQMGRHMLGVVAAPISRPDDRFLLLTAHLESLREFQEERIKQFKRCMQVLTETFSQDDDEEEGCSAGEEYAAKSETQKPVQKTSKKDKSSEQEEGPGRGGLTAGQQVCKPPAVTREIPAFVGIFGGDMNIRDQELQASAASEAKGRARQQGRGRPMSGSGVNKSERSGNVFRTNGMAESGLSGKAADSSAAERESLVLPGVEDVWEFLGRPASAKYTWDMLRNDNKEGGKWKARHRFDRLYWYGLPSHEAGRRQNARNARRTDASTKTVGAGEGTTCERNRGTDKSSAAKEETAASEALATSEKVNKRSAAGGVQGQHSSSCERREKDEQGTVRWTWKPESLRLVGTRKLPTCGRFPSDHFGLLARFKRLPFGKDLRVPED